MNILHFLDSFIMSGHLSCLYLLATVHNAAMNLGSIVWMSVP
jgi:hypothetical protein